MREHVILLIYLLAVSDFEAIVHWLYVLV